MALIPQIGRPWLALGGLALFSVACIDRDPTAESPLTGPFSLPGVSQNQAGRECRRPVWVIAHRCNDPLDVRDVVIAHGVNAIEADFFYHTGGPFLSAGWYVDHADFGVIPITATRLDLWLEKVADFARSNRQLAIIWVDLKRSDRFLPELYGKLRKALPNDLYLVFSVAWDDRKNLLALKDSLRERDGLDISAGAEPQEVVAFFTQESVKRYWYAEGVFSAAPEITVPNLRRRVETAMTLRSECSRSEKIKGVYSWTYENESSIIGWLEKEIDAILVNARECYRNPWDIADFTAPWPARNAVAYAMGLPERIWGTREISPFGDGQPPVVTAPGPLEVECTGTGGTPRDNPIITN